MVMPTPSLQCKTDERSMLLEAKVTAADVDVPKKTGSTRIGTSDLARISRKELDPLPQYTDLPESIYGAAMMATFRFSLSDSGSVRGIAVSVMLGLFINTGMQFYILYCTKKYICGPAVMHVRQLYAEYHTSAFDDAGHLLDDWTETWDRTDELCQLPLSQPYFYLALLCVWTGTCYVDLCESFRYLTYLWKLPEPAEGESAECDHDDEAIVITHLARGIKITIAVLVFLPKVFIAMFLWWLGARWLTSTLSFQDLMLNAVALAFITEMDELIYKVLVPTDIQAIVNTYKIMRVEHEDHMKATQTEDMNHVHRMRDKAFVTRIVGMLLALAFNILFPMVYMYKLQQVIPGYQWDVHGPCEERVREMLGDTEEAEGAHTHVSAHLHGHHAHHR
mmetsp:Transcript_120716/g.385475  ORF Transcript_120716/g.385475 Transcript_120716/m.385475 type:complete len:392 (-) Transcript_120716:158-1333(-)